MALRLEPATSASGDSEAAPSDRRGDQTGDHRWSTINAEWPAALCCALYVVLAMAVYGHLGSLGSGHMAGTVSSGLDRTDLVARLGGPCAAAGTQHVLGPRAELSVRSEFRGERVNAGPRCPLHADHEVVRACSHLEHLVTSGTSSLGDLNVSRAPPVDHLVASGLPRRTSLRLLRLHHSLRRIPLSHLRAVATVGLPTPPRDLGATAMAAGENRGSCSLSS